MKIPNEHQGVQGFLSVRGWLVAREQPAYLVIELIGAGG